jgi:hypothetical protein
MGRKKRKQPRQLASKLRKIRSVLNVGQGEMANILRRVDDAVYPGLISRFERGLAEPSLLVLLEYSRLVRVSLEVLVDDKLELTNPRRRKL